MTKTNLPANFLLYLKNGEMKIKYDNTPSIQFYSNSNMRVINIIDFPIKLSKKTGFFKKLKEAKSLAKDLAKNNVTLEIKYQGKTVLRLGKKAKPRLSRALTMTGNIEISDMKTLLQLEKSF